MKSFNKRSLFLIAVGVGFLSVFLSIVLPMNPNFFGVFVPVVVLFCYIYFGFSSEASNAENTQFADSIYYLGFIFTLFALCATLYDFEDVTDTVIARFGLALITTLIGLVVRVSLTNFNTSYTEALSRAENSLYLSVMRFDAHLKANLQHLSEFEHSITSAAQTSIDAHQVNVDRINDVSEKAISSVSEEISAAVSRLRAELDGVDVPKNLFADKLMPPLEELKQDLSNLHQSISTFSEAQETTLARLGDHTNGLSDMLEEANRNIASSFDGFGTVNDLCNSLSHELAQLNAEVHKSVATFDEENITSMAKSMGKLSAEMEAAAGKIESSFSRVNALGTNIDSLFNGVADLTSKVQVASKAIDDQVAAIRDLGEVSSASAQQLGDLAGATKQLQGAIDQIQQRSRKSDK